MTEVTITLEDFGKAFEEKIAALEPFGPRSKQGWYFTFDAGIELLAYEYLKDKLEDWDGMKLVKDIKVYRGGKIPVYFFMLNDRIIKMKKGTGWNMTSYSWKVKD